MWGEGYLEPVQNLGVCGFSSIILSRARRKSESILSYGELFQRSNRQNLPKRRARGDSEQALIYCKLKHWGCDPDAVTADGKADRNITTFTLLSEKELQNHTFENLGVVTTENSVNTAFYKELK